MNLTKLKPFAFLAGFLCLIIVILLLITLFKNSSSSKKAQIYTPPSPPKFSPKALPQAQNFASELDKIIKDLPYKTATYSLEYLKGANIINVKLFGANENELLTAKQDAEKFIKDKGVTDICALNIFWITQVSQEVRENLNAKNYITTGCKP